MKYICIAYVYRIEKPNLKVYLHNTKAIIYECMLHNACYEFRG